MESQTFSLKYRVERREIWKWYWSTWWRPDGLWRYWLVFGLLVLGAVAGVSSLSHSVGWNDALLAAAIIGCVFTFFVIFPQLAHKPQERTLGVSAAGIRTTIGERSGLRDWKDISLVVDGGDYIALVVAGGIPVGLFWVRTRNGNAFVIPNRAFKDEKERNQFIEAVSAWQNATSYRFPRLAWRRYYAEAA